MVALQDIIRLKSHSRPWIPGSQEGWHRGDVYREVPGAGGRGEGDSKQNLETSLANVWSCFMPCKAGQRCGLWGAGVEADRKGA